MTLLFKQALILDQYSPFHLQSKDVLIVNGVITNIDTDINNDAARIISEEGLCLSAGFIDMFAHFNEPGYEHKETLISGAKAALKGGYTTVCVVPNTSPVLDNKAAVEYIVKQQNLPVTIVPIGAVTTATNGQSLAEMYEMYQSGAVAFSDGWQPIQDGGLLLKALQYVKAIDAVLIQLPYHKDLQASGLVNEGIAATQLGLPGIPTMAEEMMVARDIELCAYTQSKLHLTGISTAKSVALIAAAKQQGLPITCSVSPYHLHYTDDELESYDTNAKVKNPLRSKKDLTALQDALLAGVIDAVASHHSPQDIDAKQCEFANAEYGMSTIEHTFQLIATVPNITPQKVYEVLHKNVQQLLNLQLSAIMVGGKANISAFTLQGENYIDATTMVSKGKNTLVNGKKLNGKIIATINNQHHYIS